jgi:DNA-binding transcriptional ArsR family regulator
VSPTIFWLHRGYHSINNLIHKIICYMKYISYVLFFRALSNPSRMRILESLSDGELSVSGICKTTGFEQSRVSHNLRILEIWGFVSFRREGKRVIYSMEKRSISPIIRAAGKHLRHHGDKICTCGILQGRRKCPHLED